MIKIVSRFPVARERNGTTSRNKEGEGGGENRWIFFFFRRTKKLLVAWRRTNEISGENLTNVFARTYTRRRIAPILVQFLEFFAIFGKNWGPIETGEREKERKNRYLVSRNRLDSNRLSRRRSRKPLDRSYFLDKSRFEGGQVDGEKGRKSRESRVTRFFTSSSPFCLRENRLSRINQSHP